jgi:hypothetical protein
MFLPLGVCAYCYGEINGGHIATCSNNRYVHFPEGESQYSIPFIPENILRGTRCPDCFVNIGGFHHPGCRYEICPRCHERLAACGCRDPGVN